jgi:hypothetical protein
MRSSLRCCGCRRIGDIAPCDLGGAAENAPPFVPSANLNLVIDVFHYSLQGSVITSFSVAAAAEKQLHCAVFCR